MEITANQLIREAISGSVVILVVFFTYLLLSWKMIARKDGKNSTVVIPKPFAGIIFYPLFTFLFVLVFVILITFFYHLFIFLNTSL